MKPKRAVKKVTDSWKKNAVIVACEEAIDWGKAGYTYAHVPGLNCYIVLPNKDADARARALRRQSARKKGAKRA